jgi:two-component system osmolarity sensor histidine kinase EnvZ
MKLFRRLKPFMPKTLFARALLILILPMVLLQLLMAYIFYERHWDSVVRNLASNTASNISMLVSEYARREASDGPTHALLEATRLARKTGMELNMNVGANKKLPQRDLSADFPEFEIQMRSAMAYPFVIKDKEKDVRVSVLLENGVMRVTFSRKRLASSTTFIFTLWMLGSSALLMLVATLFLRNQIRPIVQLARAAEQFGLGQELHDFSPRGASEVRRAGRAFITMAERIRRQVQTRTDMLSGISHDLRTPLTRMMLDLEMSAIEPKTRDALKGDVQEMRHMVEEYLSFARGDSAEGMMPMDIAALMEELVQNYQRQDRPVRLVGSAEPVMLSARPQAIRRLLQNLIDNALRYGGEAELSLEVSQPWVRVKVVDKGAGIPDAEHDTVFKPFTRLESSRNSKTGGVGLGLSIARDIAHSHGGEITLENQRDTAGNIIGLEATIRLPRERHG